jgi:hypothetical protein
MSRQVDIISGSEGEHYLVFGWNQSELASFSLQMWITHYGQRAIDWAQALSQGFCTFMGGDIWEHNDPNTPRATLFGEHKDVKVGIIANQDANVIKLLDSIGVHSDGKWEVESVTIPKTLNYPNGMESKIPKERFKKRDGVWQSEFLRNMKTSSGTISAVEAIKGEPLKGYSAYLVLKNTDTSETKLFKVDLNMTKSR